MVHYHWVEKISGQVLSVIPKLKKKVDVNYQKGDFVSYNNEEFHNFYENMIEHPNTLIGEVIDIKKNKKAITGRPFYETTIKVIKAKNAELNGTLITEPCQLFLKKL